MAPELSSSSQHDSTQAAPPAMPSTALTLSTLTPDVDRSTEDDLKSQASTVLPLELVLRIAGLTLSRDRQLTRADIREAALLRLASRAVFVHLHARPSLGLETVVERVVTKFLRAPRDDAYEMLRTSLTFRCTPVAVVYGSMVKDPERLFRLISTFPNILALNMYEIPIAIAPGFQQVASDHLRALQVSPSHLYKGQHGFIVDFAPFKNLRYLELWWEEQAGGVLFVLPSSFGWPPSLEHLRIGHLTFQVQQDIKVWECLKLETFEMVNCGTAGYWTFGDQRLDLPAKRSLKTLAFRDNRLNDADFAALEIHRIPSLEQLQICSEKLSNLQVLQLSALPKLVYLHVSSYYISSLKGLDIRQHRSLHTLGLNGISLVPGDLRALSEALSSHEALDRLDLSGSHLDDLSVAEFDLSGSRSLRVLDLHMNQLSGEGLKHLKLESNTSLRYVNVYANQGITPVVAQQFASPTRKVSLEMPDHGSMTGRLDREWIKLPEMMDCVS